MKKLKKITAVILAAITVLCCFTVSVCAENDTVELKMLNYNVAGLPKFDGTDVVKNQLNIAEYIVKGNFDIIGVQEDFGYHKNLEKGLLNYDFSTNHTGGIPGGDGLNIFTKGMPIYNESRYQWLKSFGDIAEGDKLTPKGMVHVVVYAGKGIYIDIYNIHADAFDTEGSREARESNFNQVADHISKNYEKYDRPVIVMGDFNTMYHATAEENSNMHAIFQERCGLKDAWIELKNNGDYSDFSSWYQTGDYWGNWDSVERFMYKGGGGIELEAIDFNYKWVLNDEGVNVSDHAAAECTFRFTVTDEFVEKRYDLKEVNQPLLRNFLNKIYWIFKDLIFVFSNFKELIEFIA